MNNFTSITAAVLCGLTTASCCIFTPDSKYLYTVSEDAEQVTVQEDSLLEIELPANPTTGYRWEFTSSDEDILELQDVTYLPPENGLIGGGGQTVCIFRADDEGTASITARCYRPWQGFDPEKDREIQWLVEVVEAE